MYLWIKAFHIIFVICWFAGIFYLPRLFVHHAMSTDKATQLRLSIMERKLYRFTTPFAFISLFLGLWMVYLNPDYYLQAGWFYAKVILIILLFAYHFYCGKLVTVFEQGNNQRSHVFYRIFNELPVFALFIIVILVVVKPF
jgi:putative membrane protein